ncbi:hypothetical protein ACFL9U_05270 [Thermodesulfobacteriota bacterium]
MKKSMIFSRMIIAGLILATFVISGCASYKWVASDKGALVPAVKPEGEFLGNLVVDKSGSGLGESGFSVYTRGVAVYSGTSVRFKSNMGLVDTEKISKAVCGGSDPVFWITVKTNSGTRTVHWKTGEDGKIYRHPGVPDDSDATCGIPENAI